MLNTNYLLIIIFSACWDEHNLKKKDRVLLLSCIQFYPTVLMIVIYVYADQLIIGY